MSVATPAARADVAIEDWIVHKGNTIEVLGPDPSVDLLQIVEDIQDASVAKRYLIKLGPGVYELGSSEILALKEFVDLRGSGQETTEIVGSRTSGGGSCGSVGGHGVVGVPDNSVLSDLTVTNDSTSSASGYALCNTPNSSPTIRRVTARTISDSGGGSRFAVYIKDGSPKLIDVTSVADSGDSAYALYCNGSTPTVDRAWLTAKNGTSRNRAIWLVGTCSIEIRDLTISAEESPINVGIDAQDGTEIDLTQAAIKVFGTGDNLGLKVAGNGEAVLHDVRIRPSGGSSNTGVELLGDAVLRLIRSTVSGSSAGIDTDSTVEALIGQSTIFSGLTGLGTASCVASDNGQGKDLDSACAVIP